MGAPKALVVDGDWRMRKLIRSNLEAAGFYVAQAGTAREALDALVGATTDVVLLSVELPDANGWNIICRLRGQAGDPDLPVVMMAPEPAYSRLLRRFRRVSQLLKPFSALTLLASVDQALHVTRKEELTLHKMTDFYGDAKKAADEGKDIDAGPINVCGMCGHTVAGDAPERCPVCGAPKARFQAF